MACRSASARCHVDVARIGRGRGDDLGNRLLRERWVYRHNERYRVDTEDGCDVAEKALLRQEALAAARLLNAGEPSLGRPANRVSAALDSKHRKQLRRRRRQPCRFQEDTVQGASPTLPWADEITRNARIRTKLATVRSGSRFRRLRGGAGRTRTGLLAECGLFWGKFRHTGEIATTG